MMMMMFSIELGSIEGCWIPSHPSSSAPSSSLHEPFLPHDPLAIRAVHLSTCLLACVPSGCTLQESERAGRAPRVKS
eukprot:3768941-Rhodomonas_salina.1